MCILHRFTARGLLLRSSACGCGRVLDASARLFAKQGYEATSTQQILDAAGVDTTKAMSIAMAARESIADLGSRRAALAGARARRRYRIFFSLASI